MPPSVKLKKSKQSDHTSKRVWLRSILIGGALVAITFVVFAPALGYGFNNYDDPVYVSQNWPVRIGLTVAGWNWAWTTLHEANWHPLTWLSLQMDASLFGDGAAGFHFTNILLHAANAVLLFVVLRAMTKQEWASALTAALFAVHPLRVESVVWITERKDVLSTFFGFIALGAYARYVERPSVRRYLPIVAAFILSLLAKPMLVTLPFLLLVLDWWPLGRFSATAQNQKPAPIRFLLMEKLPLLALTIVSSIVTLYAQSHGGTVRSFEEVSLPVRFGNTLVAYATYLSQMIWPFDLAVLYPLPNNGWDASRVLISTLVLVLLSVFAVIQRRQRPYLLTGWLWYLGTLVPVIGLVQVGVQAYADRYTYLPSVGIFLALSCSLTELIARGQRVLTASIAGVILACLIARTHSQLQYWRDNITLWTHTIQVVGNNRFAYINLTSALTDAASTATSLADATKKWEKCAEVGSYAVKLWPDDPKILNNLGGALVSLNRMEEAFPLLERSLRLDPKNSTTHMNIGAALGNRGWYKEAIPHFQFALERDINNTKANISLGRALRLAGRPQEALDSLRRAISLVPNDAEACCELALVLEDLGNFKESLPYAQRAVELQPKILIYRLFLAIAFAHRNQNDNVQKTLIEAFGIDPNWPAMADNQAWILSTSNDDHQRNGRRAVDLAGLACYVTEGKQARYLDTLAAAYAEAGKFTEAVDVERKAVELATATGDIGLAREAGNRLQLYGQGKAFRGDRLPSTP